jgi:hypothetical protein
MEEKRENRKTAYEYSRALGYTPREANCLTLPYGPVRAGLTTSRKNRRGSSAYGIAQLLGEADSKT